MAYLWVTLKTKQTPERLSNLTKDTKRDPSSAKPSSAHCQAWAPAMRPSDLCLSYRKKNKFVHSVPHSVGTSQTPCKALGLEKTKNTMSFPQRDFSLAQS